MVGLALESDFDRIERVFNVFADDAGDLEGEHQWLASEECRRVGGRKAIPSHKRRPRSPRAELSYSWSQAPASEWSRPRRGSAPSFTAFWQRRRGSGPSRSGRLVFPGRGKQIVGGEGRAFWLFFLCVQSLSGSPLQILEAPVQVNRRACRGPGQTHRGPERPIPGQWVRGRGLDELAAQHIVR